MQKTFSRTKVILFSGVIIIGGSLIGLVLLNAILGWQQRRIDTSSVMAPGLVHYDQLLGWKLTPGWQGTHAHYDFEVTYSVNPTGFRGSLPGESQSQDSYRIAVLGDSFTFGLGANDDEIFTELLNSRADAGSWLNFAVPGYSTDQEYLLMRNSLRRFQADHYLLVVYLGNDFLDNALPYPLQAEQAKPFYEVAGRGELVLRNTPVPRQPKPAALRQKTLGSIVFGDADQPWGGKLLRPVTSSHLFIRLFGQSPALSAEATRQMLSRRLEPESVLMDALVGSMRDEAVSRGAGFSIALLPGASYVTSPNSYSARFQDHVREVLLGIAEEMAIPCLDLSPALQAINLKPGNNGPLYHPHEGHLTAEGHAAVADLLQAFLGGGTDQKSR